MQINIVSNLDKNYAQPSGDEELALLSGVVKSCGALTISKSGIGIELAFNDYESALYVTDLLKKLIQKDISLKKNTQTVGKNQINTFTVIANSANVRDILEKIGILNFSTEDALAFSEGIPLFVDTTNLFIYYFMGILIGKSKISVPDIDSTGRSVSNSYRMEVRNLDFLIATQICERLDEEDIKVKIKGEGDNTTIFCTECDTIIDIMAFVKASKAVIKITDSKVEREVKSQAVRETNCELANITKSVDLSEKLRIAIQKLIKADKYTLMSRELQETYSIKLDNPEFSLEEIGAALGISKSAVNHRFRKIIELAKEN